jgi:hypothetical protein
MSVASTRYNISKLQRVAGRNQEANVRNQQGTTRNIYDTLELTGQTNLTFFQNANSRTFPLTNLTQNQFPDNVSMMVQRVYLTVLTTTAALPAGTISSIDGIKASSLPQFNASELTMTIAGQQVIDRFSLLSTQAEFNKSAKFGSVSATSVAATGALVTRQFIEHCVFAFDIDVAILPNRTFTASIQLPVYATPGAGTKYLRLTLEGIGTIQKVVGTI